MQSVNCYLCGRNDGRLLFTESRPGIELKPEHVAARKGSVNQAFRYRWIRCRHCGLVYANPVPDEKDLAALYIDSDQADYGNETAHLVHTYRRYLKRFLPQLHRRDRALDVGCGSGFFLQELKKMGFERVDGVEPSLSACRQALPEVRSWIHNSVFDPSLFPESDMDCITCFQTLEHMADPRRFVRDLAHLLKPGGLVLAVAHDVGNPAVRLLRHRHPIVNAGHVCLFDRRTLARLFALELEVIDVFPIRNRYSMAYWASMMPIGRRTGAALVRGMQWTGLADRPVSLKLGNIGIAARRNAA